MCKLFRNTCAGCLALQLIGAGGGGQVISRRTKQVIGSRRGRQVIGRSRSRRRQVVGGGWCGCKHKDFTR